MGQFTKEYKKMTILMNFDYNLTKLYKLNFIVGIVKNYIFLIINISIWSFFTKDFGQTMAYFLLIQLFSSFFTTDIAEKLSYSISSGMIGSELALPIDIRKKMLYESFGMLKFNIQYSFIPTLIVIIIACIHYNIVTISFNPILILILLINIIITYGIIYLIEILIGLMAVKTVYIWGVISLKNSLMMLLSGSIIPLYVFGDKFLTIYQYTFFYNIYFFNIELITNQLTIPKALTSLAIQCLWLIIIYFIQKIIFNRVLFGLDVGGG